MTTQNVFKPTRSRINFLGSDIIYHKYVILKRNNVQKRKIYLVQARLRELCAQEISSSYSYAYTLISVSVEMRRRMGRRYKRYAAQRANKNEIKNKKIKRDQLCRKFSVKCVKMMVRDVQRALSSSLSLSFLISLYLSVVGRPVYVLCPRGGDEISKAHTQPSRHTRELFQTQKLPC